MSDPTNSSRGHARDEIDISKHVSCNRLTPTIDWLWWSIMVAGLFASSLLGQMQGDDAWWVMWSMPVAVLILLAVWVGWRAIGRRRRLAWIHRAQLPAQAMARGDAAGAEQAFQRALARARRFAATDHRRGMMLVELAGYVKNQGRSNEAKELYEECVAILAKHQRTHPADFFVSLNNYAIFFMHLRDYDAAQQILERVLDLILPAAKGREVGLPRRLDGLEFILHLNVAYLFMLMHQLTEAKHHLQEADALFQGLPGPRQKAMRDHFVCLRALWNYEAGKFANAWSEIERVENPDYAANLSVRAKLHLVALEYAAAEELRRKSFDQERKKGTLHRPELLDATLELAESLFGQGKHDEAFTSLQEARSIVADFVLPTDEPWRKTLTTWRQRAKDLGRTKLAASLEKELAQVAAIPNQAITIREKFRVYPQAAE